MKIYKIKKDTISLFVDVYGGRGRPLIKTRFKKGNKVAAFVFNGSINVGVGKDKTCEKGIYLEYWCSAETKHDFLWHSKNSIDDIKRINNCT